MKREIRDKWTAALRSGDYVQGQYSLCNDKEQYCCLGVLLDVVEPGGWTDKGTRKVAHALGERSVSLSAYGRRELGLTTNAVCALVTANDSLKYGKSFREIAAWIESHITDSAVD